MEWLDAKTIYTIAHIFGAILGAGGAYVSDAMFFSSAKDKIISKRELQFMKIGSSFVWAGLLILIVSGALLFLTNPSGYMESSKFLIKMLIVLVILVNGVYFHARHLPILHRHADSHYTSSAEFIKNKKLLMISGVISITSWTFAVILGGLRMIPIDFVTALIIYIIFEIVAIVIATTFFKKIF